MLIILPGHLAVSGVTTWAMRAIAGLRVRGIDAGLIVHSDQTGHVPSFLSPYVAGIVLNAPDMDELHGNLDQLVPTYLSAIKRMHAKNGKPVVVSPNLHGDCFGAIASIARDHPELIRIAGWIHADNDYDISVCKYFNPMIHAFVPVSAELGKLVAQSIPHRIDDIVHIPHGVDVPDHCPNREPISNRPIQLLYTGRIEEYQKRVSVLPLLSRYLDDRQIPHTLRVVGDGPAMDTLRSDAQSQPNIQIIGAIPPQHINTHLQWADGWVLPSRFEGQSVAMLEAMAHGCVPIVTQVRSGASDAVIHDQSGLSIESKWDTPSEQIAQNMGDSIASITQERLSRLSHGAHQLVHDRHRTELHIDALESLITRVQAMPARKWPHDKRSSYTAAPGELSGSTPPDAPDRMRRCLASLQGKSVLIFGSGQHTKDLGRVITKSGSNIVGIIDDDPKKIGTKMHGIEIYASISIAQLGATDLVISSAIHQDSIWKKRAQFESQGLVVHRLYHDELTTIAD